MVLIPQQARCDTQAFPTSTNCYGFWSRVGTESGTPIWVGDTARRRYMCSCEHERLCHGWQRPLW